MYLKTKNHLHTTQISSFKYVLIVFFFKSDAKIYIKVIFYFLFFTMKTYQISKSLKMIHIHIYNECYIPYSLILLKVQ